MHAGNMCTKSIKLTNKLLGVWLNLYGHVNAAVEPMFKGTINTSCTMKVSSLYVH